MGKKTAQRVLLELKEKVGAQEMAGTGLGSALEGGADMRAEAISALVGLGYDGASALKAVTAAGNADTIEELITLSLRKLAKQ